MPYNAVVLRHRDAGAVRRGRTARKRVAAMDEGGSKEGGAGPDEGGGSHITAEQH